MTTTEDKIYDENNLLADLALEAYTDMSDPQKSDDEKVYANRRFLETIRVMHEAARTENETAKLELEERRHAEQLELEKQKLEFQKELEIDRRSLEYSKLASTEKIELRKLDLEERRIENEFERHSREMAHKSIELQQEFEIERMKQKTENFKTIAKIAISAAAVITGGIIAHEGYKVELNSVNTMKETTNFGKGMFNGLFKPTLF